MKRLLICIVLLGVILAAARIAASKEKGRWGRRGHRKMSAVQAGDPNACLAADPKARPMRDPNAPWRRPRAGLMKRALEKRIARLESIRAIAAEEGATKTAEALDKLIAENKERFENRAQMMRQRRGNRRADFDGEKAEGKWHGPHGRPRRGSHRGRHWEPEPELEAEPES